MKFKRTYRITIQVSDKDTVVIEPPKDHPEKLLTFIFDISRGTIQSSNRGTFQIYNLAPSTRVKIFHDRFDYKNYRGIVVQAGYEDQFPLPIIFQGNIQIASSYRRGTDWITEIEAYDGGFGIANGQVSQTVPAGWTLPQLFKTLLGSMQHVGVGAIGDFSQQSNRGLSLYGSPWEIAGNTAANFGANAFIDNEMANILAPDQYIKKEGGIDVIEASTGLLNTPRRYDANLSVEILFEPRLIVGQLVQFNSIAFEGIAQEFVLSSGQKQYLAVNNGQYKVMSITHRGTISGATGGQAVTTALLYLGAQTLVGIEPVQESRGPLMEAVA